MTVALYPIDPYRASTPLLAERRLLEALNVRELTSPYRIGLSGTGVVDHGRARPGGLPPVALVKSAPSIIAPLKLV